jgi:hypothetical protein
MDPKDKLIEYQNYRIEVLQNRLKKLETKIKTYEKRKIDRVI